MTKSSSRRGRTRRPSTSSISSTTTRSSNTSSSSSSTSSTEFSESLSKFNRQLNTLGLRLRSVPRDGNCLFSAFADQLTGRAQDHVRLRQQAVDYLRKHRREIRPFLGDTSYSVMLSELAELGTFGDHLSLVALARAKHVDIIVHRLGESPSLVARGCPDINSCTTPSHPQVHLAFHEDEEHYSSVRWIDGPSHGPANVSMDLRKLEKSAARPSHRRRYRSECPYHHNRHHRSSHRQRSPSGCRI
ncbi:hypothetical protein Aperf_G00000064089 [Anoplocephala perfoliata]